MSDTNNAGDTPDSSNTPPPPPNPYGQPPASSDPYGQPPAAPAPSDPYGQPPAAPAYGQQPAYGQPAYPQQPAYGAPAGYGADPDKRPGSVTAAGVITIVFAGLSFLLYAIILVALLVASDTVVDEIEASPGFEDVGISADDALGVMVAFVGVFALWCLIATILGFLVLRRSNGARITLVVSSAVSALISLVGIGSGVSALTLIASVAVIVLLFVGGASDWFKRTPVAG